MILRLFCVVSAAVIHELGHILAAKLCGVRSWRLGLKAGGALITFDFSRLSYMREVFVHLAGPAFGVMAALFSVIFFGERAEYFAGVSLSMALVNLLPVSGFDGGGIFSAVVSMFCLPDLSYRICRAVSFCTSAVLWGAVVLFEIKYGANIGLLAFTVAICMRNFI